MKEKQEKQDAFPKFKKLTGQNIWNASHSIIWKKKMENMEIQKKIAKIKNLEI